MGLIILSLIWAKVLKVALKKFEGIWSALGRPYSFQFFKGCLSQILLSPFLNNLNNFTWNFCSHQCNYFIKKHVSQINYIAATLHCSNLLQFFLRILQKFFWKDDETLIHPFTAIYDLFQQNRKMIPSYLSHLMLLISFYNPWKYQKIWGFLML